MSRREKCPEMNNDPETSDVQDTASVRNCYCGALSILTFEDGIFTDILDCSDSEKEVRTNGFRRVINSARLNSTKTASYI